MPFFLASEAEEEGKVIILNVETGEQMVATPEEAIETLLGVSKDDPAYGDLQETYADLFRFTGRPPDTAA